MRDPLPIVCRLGEDLTKVNPRTEQLYRRTGRAEVKALVMMVALSSSPAQDLAVALGVPEDVMETWWEEARDMLSKSTQIKTEDRHARPLGVVA